MLRNVLSVLVRVSITLCVCVCVCVCIFAFSAFDFKNWIALKRNEEKYNLKSEVESVCVEERERKMCV